MDCSKAGKLIYSLRKEKGMTQKELAEVLNISDKTVSKWERGLGYPDISLINELSNTLGVNLEELLQGDLSPNIKDIGKISRVKFYVCPDCNNLLYSTGNAYISCCGRKLTPLRCSELDDNHITHVEEIENDYYISVKHGMTKEHYISFLAYVSYDRVLMVRLYPEQDAQIRIPRMGKGKIYLYCNHHGLMMV